MIRQATLRFYAELRDSLPRAMRSGEMIRSFDVPGSVKDMIEACGVPHTEVDLILANSRSVGFSYLVEDGDRIAVFPHIPLGSRDYRRLFWSSRLACPVPRDV